MDRSTESDDSVEQEEELAPELAEEPLFAGVTEVVALIRYLYERPGFGDRPRMLELGSGWRELEDRRERSHRRGLPMVCLVRPEGPDELLGALAKRLGTAAPTPVPHAFDRLAEVAGSSTFDGKIDPLKHDDVMVVRDRLRTLANKLARSTNAKTGRFRFRLFSLAHWLMDQDLAEDSLGQERELLARLRAKDPIARVKNILDDASANLPDAPAGLPWLVAVLRWVPLAVFRGKVTGRLPLLSGPYRWFLRQPNLNPELPGGFVGFAERLTAKQWQEEDPEQVARLLTNAFLEDLRRAYRWRPWQLLRRRRTTYVTVLLDNITRANGGYALLRLINDVRNAIGRFDPLLVVSASRKVPPDAGRDSRRPKHDAEHAGAAYQAWQDSLLADRRKHRDNAWYLPLRIPSPPSTTTRDGLRQKMDLVRPYRVPSAAWWSRRAVRVGLVIVLLAGFVTGYYEWSASHCGGGIRWPGLSPSLVWTGSECVGITDGSDNIFQPSDDTLKTVLTVIKTQNDQAVQRHVEQPQRPYITVAVMEAFTSATTSQSGGLTSERESLEGAAVAQADQLNASGDADPIVRLLIVNAGRGMGAGQQVAQQLGVLAARDPSVVGVVGLDQTRQPTVDTINALANVGLPSIGAALSADSLSVNHPMYFQVAPQNSREVAVAAAFAGQLPTVTRSVRVYYSADAADVYSRNLRDDVVAAFHQQGFQTQAVAFTPSPAPGAPVAQAGDQVIGNAAAAGRDTCSVNGLVYFAGRGLPDFADFLSGAKQCGSQAVLLADDDVTRYVADADVREQNRALPFYYQSFALAPNTVLQGVTAEFYGELDKLFTFENGKTTGRSFDGYAALTFDATRTFITAAEYLRESNGSIPVTPGSVWRELTAIHHSQSGLPDNAIVGVTGQIDFGGDITRHVPLDKPVAILRVAGGEVEPKPVGLCGTDASFRPQSSWCPALLGSG
jgi:hypothetical protein